MRDTTEQETNKEILSSNYAKLKKCKVAKTQKKVQIVLSQRNRTNILGLPHIRNIGPRNKNEQST